MYSITNADMCLTFRDHDGKVTPEEVASAAAYLKSTLDKDGFQELISKLAKDRGSFDVLISLYQLAFDCPFTA